MSSRTRHRRVGLPQRAGPRRRLRAVEHLPEGAVTQEAIDYISTVAVLYRTTTTEVVNLTFTGDLEDYGVVIPSASEGLQLAAGAEYRKEWLSNVPDEVYQTVDAAGFGSPTSLDAGFNVMEPFLEALVPIVQDARGAQDLSLELGYRYSDYSHLRRVNTYKAQLSYAPSLELAAPRRLQPGDPRGQHWRAVLPQTLVLGGGDDISAQVKTRWRPSSSAHGPASPAHMYGHVLPNPSPQYNALDGGNPSLGSGDRRHHHRRRGLDAAVDPRAVHHPRLLQHRHQRRHRHRCGADNPSSGAP